MPCDTERVFTLKRVACLQGCLLVIGCLLSVSAPCAVPCSSPFKVCVIRPCFCCSGHNGAWSADHLLSGALDVATRSDDYKLSLTCVFVPSDPHPGNIAVDAVNGGRLIYYDFGELAADMSLASSLAAVCTCRDCWVITASCQMATRAML